jgi:hypothetical protein
MSFAKLPYLFSYPYTTLTNYTLRVYICNFSDTLHILIYIIKQISLLYTQDFVLNFHK